MQPRAARIACARRFNAGVESQQVRLERDLVDHTDDVGDLLGRLLDLAHGMDRGFHDPAAFLGRGFTCGLCVLWYVVRA